MIASRRAFLQQASGAALAGFATMRPGRELWRKSPADLMPEPDEALMTKLALAAVDAARAAGAQFADIRVLASRHFSAAAICIPDMGRPLGMGPPLLGFSSRYGIRVLVDGVWGFVSETEMTVDGVTKSAQTAVLVARSNKARRRKELELAPVPPAVKGTWASPMEHDPLTVPLHEQGELVIEAARAASLIRGVHDVRVYLIWRRPTVVFASTEGALIVQRFSFADPQTFVAAWLTENGRTGFGTAAATTTRTGQFGYEAAGADQLVGEMRAAGERAVEEARMRRSASAAEVGRYDLVFTPGAVSNLVSSTLDAALDAPSALGYEADESGISFASPPMDMLGSYRIASPLITVRADRTQPGGAATVGWDEEGVAPEAYTTVDRGIITDYHTSRQTAVELGDWYRRRAAPVRAHGCMRGTGGTIPTIRTPNLTLEPGAQPGKAEELFSGVKKGLYIMDISGMADHQVLNAQYEVKAARLIRNGVLAEYVTDAAIQFITPSFWKSVDAIGGPNSVSVFPAVTDGLALMDHQQLFPHSTFSMVPLRARQVNVLNIGRTA